MRIGATFSATNARWSGLDAKEALARVIDLGFEPLRLCGYWDQPLSDLEWQVEAAVAAARKIVVTVGMKAPRWPEFHVPTGLTPAVRRGGAVGRPAPVAAAALTQIETLVTRFRDSPAIEWWQVENEPSNRSGPRNWWISTEQLRAEVGTVRALDGRPVVLTAFGHFDRLVDYGSGNRLLNGQALLGRGSGVEPDLLSLLQPEDVLGLDLYHSIGRPRGVWHAGPPERYLSRWQEEAGRRGIGCWVTELQAEPWEPTPATQWTPRSVAPDDVADRLREVAGAGAGTVLLWGIEYWLAQEKRGNRDWLDAGLRALRTYTAR